MVIDSVDRLFIGTLFALVGGALQAAAQSSDFMIVARVVTGIGTGALTGITPVLVSETSTASHRGEIPVIESLSRCGRHSDRR